MKNKSLKIGQGLYKQAVNKETLASSLSLSLSVSVTHVHTALLLKKTTLHNNCQSAYEKTFPVSHNKREYRSK